MSERKFEKAVFIDRDGVINHDPGDYTYSVSDFMVLPGVLEHLQKLYNSGFGLIVITNQGGIAKKLYSESDVHAIHQYFQGQCILHGFVIDAFCFCPHHEAYTGRCLCRKPGSLLIEKALHKFNLKPENCVMIGDKPRDIEAAGAAGVKGILIETNAGIRADLALQ